MRLAIIAALIVLAGVSPGSEDPGEMPALLSRLNDEEFSVRDAASIELGKYPLEYAERFLVMAQTEKEPEVKARLESIARHIFVEQVVKKDDQWSHLMSDVGIVGIRYYYWSNSSDWERFKGYIGYGPALGRLISGVGDPASGKLEANDMIVQVNKSDIASVSGAPCEWAKIGEEVELTVRRYKDPRRLERGEVRTDDTEFMTIVVRIKAVERKRFDKMLDAMAAARMEQLWRDYKLRFDQKHPSPEVPYGLPSKLQGVYPKGP